MSLLKWSLAHHAARTDVETLVSALGFSLEEDSPDIWVRKVAQGTVWREMKLRMRPHEVVVFVHCEEEAASETYFEYLFEGGFLAGKLAARMELLAPLPPEEEEEDDYDMDEDVQELAGATNED